MTKAKTVILPDSLQTTIQHRKFRQCTKQILASLQPEARSSLIIVTGPTGSGKTTLLKTIINEVSRETEGEVATDPEMVPIAGCTVKAPGPTAFSWKDTYIQLLYSLQHAYADMFVGKRPRESLSPQDGSFKTVSPDSVRRAPNDHLFRVLQTTVKHRKPRAIFLDEAHHLLRLASSQSLENQLEHLKYMADELATPLILFGTYDLIRMMNYSGQIIRRREIVHLSRYIFDSSNAAASLEPFAEIVAAYRRDLSAFTKFDLLDEVPYLYSGSVGCVGVLQRWLARAYIHTQSEGGKSITRSLMDELMLPCADREALLDEAIRGERYFAGRHAGENGYMTKLGFVQEAAESLDGNKAEPPRGRRGRKPGKRLPHNDPVGLDSLDPQKQKRP